jgi:hypothetical protein
MRKVHYDPTITLGHVIQAVTLAAAIFLAILRYEYKVDRLEESTKDLKSSAHEISEAQKTQERVIVSMDKAITKLTWIVEHK